MREKPPTEGVSDPEANTRSRRRFLLGIGATTAAFAGCLSDDSDDDDPDDDTEAVDGEASENGGQEGEDGDQPHLEPNYTGWLPDEEWLYFGYVDYDLEPVQEGGDLEIEEDFEDPLVSFPVTAGPTTVGLFAILLGPANLFDLTENQEAFDSEPSSLLSVNGTLVIEGSFDTDEVSERLKDGFTTYEQDGTINGYDRYEPVEVPEEIEDAPVVALSEDAVLVSEESDRLERVAATGDGDRESATETETVEWLAGQVGEGEVAFGQIGPVPEEEFDIAALFGENGFEGELLFQPADDEDVMATASFDGDQETVESRFGLVGEDLTEDTRETVETEFGALGEDTAIDIDEDRLSATAVYDVDDITVETDETDEPEREELSAAEAEALVSPDAVSYRYEPPVDEETFGEFVAEITDETAATGIRAETDSDWHSEISQPEGTIDPGTSVQVQVDPDGDMVTVFAIDENNDIGELATKEVPTDELSSEVVPEDSLSFEYEPPETGEFGSLTITVSEDTEADVLVAQPQEAAGFFGDHEGEIGAKDSVEAGTTLQVAVEPEGDEVVVFATANGTTGEVTRWEGP